MDEAVLILGPPDDLHVLAVADRLRRHHGLATYQIDLQRFPVSARASFTIGQDRQSGRWTDAAIRLDLDAVRSVWWRRPQPAAVPRVYAGADHGGFMQTEADHFLHGLFWSRRCLWVNDPMNNLRASRKVLQLSRAAECGLAVPATIVTNDAAEARAFLRSVPGRAVFKRVGSGPGPATKTSFVTPEIEAGLETIAECPTTFQEYIEARCDLRVIWIDGELWAVSIDSQAGATPEDCRFDNSVRFEPWTLPPSIQDALSRLMGDLGLVFGAIDLRLGSTGEYYFLEVNPAGQFVYLELKTGIPLIAALASLLAGGRTLPATTGRAQGQAALEN